MSELQEKVKKSIERLKTFCPEEGYYLAFSGGKDSAVCKALLDMSGCKYDATYRVTTVDPPELVKFIKEKHPDVKREIPRYSESYKNEKLAGKPITMWNLIPEKTMPPTRIARYCCAALKESGGDGRMTVTGVRWAESNNRKKNQGIVTLQNVKVDEAPEGFRVSPRHGSLILVNDSDDNRRLIEQCYRRNKTVVNPIIDWSDQEVWQFINSEKIPHCDLYHEGFHRLGCVGCPMASTNEREKQFYRWSKYKDSYLRAFDKMLQIRKERHNKNPNYPVWGWETDSESKLEPTARDVFNWWMEYDVLPGQMNWFEDFEDSEDGE